MKFRKWTLVAAMTLLAGLAMSTQLPAQDNPNLTMLAGGDGHSKVIVYGDSIVDNGNIYRVLGFPGPPYWHGRWSNGPIAVDDLAAILGVPLLDYGYAAATTGVGDLIDGGTTTQLGSLGLPGVTTAYNTIDSIPRDTIRHSLFIIEGGFNDFTSDGLTTTVADQTVARFLAIVTDLQKRGAQRILVPGLFDMGMVPYYNTQDPQTIALATQMSRYLNQKLVASLPKGVVYFDTFSLYRKMRDNPGAFGLTDVVDQCYDPSTNTACSNPHQYLFWDFVHPTAHVHLIVAVGYALTVAGFDQFAVPVAALAEP